MDFVTLTKKDKEDYFSQFALPDGRFKMPFARESPTRFSYFMLNTKPRPHQHHFFNNILDTDRLLVVKARQLGFTTAIAMFALWAAFFNKYKSGVNKNTKIGIISKEDDAAKKVLLQVRDLIRIGDGWMSMLLKGKPSWSQTFFSGMLKEPNTTEVITFKNGSFIKSFPPTSKVRGNSFDIVFVDEAAFLRCEDPNGFYYKVIEPTTVDTNGKIIILSTPNGQSGFFYDLADPFNQQSTHDFRRLFYHYSVSHDENYLRFIEKQKRIMDTADFEQEYCCSFNSSKKNFFIPQKVDEAIHPELDQSDWSGYEFVAGIDFGMTNSRTVISLATKKDDKICVPYVFRFNASADVNLVVPKLESLKRSGWNIVKVVADDCPQGNAIISQLEKSGWYVEKFNFKRDKNKYYVSFRSFLNDGLIWILKHEILTKEMHELRQEETKQANLRIHKPNAGTDDCIDSVVMACSQYLDDKSRFNVYMV